MHRSHKIRLYPTNKQQTQLTKSAGVARFAYNWALARWQELHLAYKSGETIERPNQYTLRKELNAIKRDVFPWMMEVTKCAPMESILDLGIAYKRFFEGRGGYPKPKKKRDQGGFRVDSSQFLLSQKSIRLPKIGWVRMAENFRYVNGRVLGATVSQKGDRWYISINAEIPGTDPVLSGTDRVVGVDFGVTDLATLSTGEKITGTKPHKHGLKKIRSLNKELHRRKKGSKNRKKTRVKLARAHARVTDQRKDVLHKLSRRLVADFDVVAIEDLNVSGMVRNHSLARSISDASFGELRRQIEYKAEETGTKIIVADRFYPSSKLCSSCGTKTKSLKLSQRSWKCEVCGVKHDRDTNAAINLAKLAGGSSVTACGDDVRPGGQANVREAGTRQPVVV